MEHCCNDCMLAVILSPAEAAFVSGLPKCDYKAHRSRVERPTAGTCTWILENTKYKEWQKAADTSRMLWISADPGCGKSVMTSFLADSQVDSATVCYFFFNADNSQQRDSVYAIAALLRQIYTAKPGLIKYGLQWQQREGASTNDFSSLWDLLLETVSHNHAGEIVCLVDALDECDAVSIRLFTTALVTYFTTPSDKSRMSPLKILVTSRPTNTIKQAFHALPEIRLKGEDEIDSISADVVKVVQENIDQLQNLGLPLDLLKNLQAQLIGGADRTFLWVVLIIKLLKDKSAQGATPNELDAIIRSRDIDDVHVHLLNESPYKAKRMFQVILAATSPLTLDELCVAMALGWKHKRLADLRNDLWDLWVSFETHVRSIGGHFLRIIQGKVYFVHSTAREFLIDPRSKKIRNNSALEWGVIPIVRTRKELFLAPLERLPLDGNHPNPGSSRKVEAQSSTKALKVPPVRDLSGTRRWIGRDPMIIKHKTKLAKEAKKVVVQASRDLQASRDIQRSKWQRGRFEEPDNWKLTPDEGFQDASSRRGYFEKSISMKWANYYLLKACIHFLCLVSEAGLAERAEGGFVDWPDARMEPFFKYAAENWPKHYRYSRREVSFQAMQICKALCTPKSSYFPCWTKYNTTYQLSFPSTRKVIGRGEPEDHTNEVRKAFLGVYFRGELTEVPGKFEYQQGVLYEQIVEDQSSEEEGYDEGDERSSLEDSPSLEVSDLDMKDDHSSSDRFRRYRQADRHLYRDEMASLSFGNSRDSYMDKVSILLSLTVRINWSVDIV